jgi:hypothetical protein
MWLTRRSWGFGSVEYHGRSKSVGGVRTSSKVGAQEGHRNRDLSAQMLFQDSWSVNGRGDCPEAGGWQGLARTDQVPFL